MQIEERAVGDVIVLAPSGRMTRNESFGAVRHQLRDLVQGGRRKLVLDLAAVSYNGQHLYRRAGQRSGHGP